jgi:AcrR family transcriptional regulator
VSVVERASPRAERTRAALLTAGRRLFSERPVDAVTVDEIVQAAEVGKGSFYNHFADREALMRAIAKEIRAHIEDAVARANVAETDPARRMARAVCTYLRYPLDAPEPAAVLVRLHNGRGSWASPLNRGLIDDIETGLARGRFGVATVESGVLYVLGVTQFALERLAREPNPALAVSLAQQICALILRGLSVPSDEADLIAAQASDEIVRRGVFAAGAAD